MSGDTLRVLLLDDEASLREPLAQYLRKNHGYIVDTTANGEDALSLLISEHYNVALVDEVLSEGPSGLDVLREIKAKYPDVEVILFTGWGMDSALEALQAGAYRYFAKPFNIEELALTIRFAAEQGQARREQKILSALQHVSAAINSSLDINEIFRRTCQAAVSLFGVDHSGVALFEADYFRGSVVAEYPENHDGLPGLVGLEFPIQGIPFEEEVALEKKVVNIPDLSKVAVLGETLEKLLASGLRAMLIVPMINKDRVVGSLGLDVIHQPRTFSQDEIELCKSLADQAAAALENARLFQEVVRRAENLKTLQSLLTTVASSLEWDQVLEKTCQAAVEFFGADHSGLVLFDPDLARGKVVAEYPAEIKTLGTVIPLRGVSDEEILVNIREPLIVYDVANEVDLGPVRDIFSRFDIRSILLVPVVSKGRLIGSFSLDAIGRQRQFTPEERELSRLFAAQVDVAIENARLLQETQQRAEQLAALRHTALAITSQLDRKSLLTTLIQQAVALLRAKSGGLYEYYPERGELVIVADHGRPRDIMGNMLKVGEGMAGRLVLSGEPFKIVDDYYQWEGKTSAYVDQRPFGAVIELPLKWQERIIGVLYVDDEVGRRFTEEDARLLSLFADHAAIALVNAELVARDAKKLRRLQRLSQTSSEIMTNLGSMSLDDRLNLIAERAAEILEAEACSILLVKGEGYLSLKASVGHREGGFEKGKEFAIRSGPKTGLTGHIAFEGKMLNACGEELDSHFAVKGETPHASSGQCYSLLAMPLKTTIGQAERLIGLLRVDNKKDNYGQAGPTICFIQEDEWILNFFAKAVVVAIENAQLFNRLQALSRIGQALTGTLDSEEVLNRIVDSAVSAFPAAQRGSIHLYDEQIGVLRLAAHTREYDPATINVLNLKPGEGIAGWVYKYHQTLVLSEAEKDPRFKRIEHPGVPAHRSMICVPLRIRERIIGTLTLINVDVPGVFQDDDLVVLSAFADQAVIAIENARLFDENVRRIRELEHMRDAIEKMASVAGIQDVLQQIVTSTCVVLEADYALIWSYDEPRDQFSPEELVAASIPDQDLERFKEEEPKPGKTAYTVMEKGWIGSTDISSPEFDFLGQSTREQMVRLGVRSFQGIALKVGDEPVGVLYVCYKLPRTFQEEDKRSLENFAAYAALALKRGRLVEQVSKTKMTAKLVAEVTALGDLQATLASITHGTQGVVGCDAVILYVYDQTSGKCDHPCAMTGVRYPDKASQYEASPNSIVYTMLRRDELYIAERITEDPLFKDRRFAREEGIESCVAIPLKAVGQKVGVMFVNFRSRHRFTADELANIVLFANQAAVAIRNAQLHERTKRQAETLGGLYEADKAITSTLALDEVLTHIAEQALRIVGADPQDGCFSYVALLEENKLRFIAGFPLEIFDDLRQNVGEIDLQKDARKSIDGHAVLTGQSQKVDEVTGNPDYIYLREKINIQSQLSVPLKIGEEIIGVLSINHPKISAFGDEDVKNVELLASQAAVAIENARRYENVETMLAGRTALAWTGMASSTWRHAIEKHAVTIREQMQLLRNDLKEPHTSESLARRVDMIERLANLILEKQITPPLSAEEGGQRIPVNELIRERTKQLWNNDLYKPASLDLRLDLDEDATVWASAEWLRRALDILIDNAVEATEGMTTRRITIASRSNRNIAEIVMSDNGKGMPQEIKSRLFREPIKRAGRTKGQGLGLMFAQMIVQTYGGHVRVDSTCPTGTTMTISLPLEY